ncbi:peptide chain release factor 2 [Selenihalanaerobacter shriftii]|uniref:Peptide chain release factor 2 n=2 Tax=Selenihalanaerobacter shriftii TaxID=142842 RepID=A0A1T4KL57_9FIRM|nr:peptide chain release factor 2 [Selenihalanaerobacter shriftii]
MSKSDFWDDSSKAQKIAKKASGIKDKINNFDNLKENLEELEVLIELAREEDEDSLVPEVKEGIKALEEAVEKLELKVLLKGEYDKNNALLSINPGAGGTESQDWAEMLLRMYKRWAEQNDYEVETLEFIVGEEAGIKSVTLQINGPYAYGYLKSEKGVHRLVRISPFDSSGRRHTSFASVDVMPDIEEDMDIDIDKNDLKIETYRASGAGGQHVNTTDSAVRITHLPTSIVVQCQTQRSQHKNRQRAMRILKAKLFDYMKEKQAEKLSEIRGEKKEIGWGSQIRSYIFHPYQLIKDHRTNLEVTKTQAVMDGHLDPLIEEYLKEEQK